MTLASFWEDREVMHVVGNGTVVWFAFKDTHCRDAIPGNTSVSKGTVEGMTKAH